MNAQEMVSIKPASREQKYFDALKRIAAYSSVEKLREDAEMDYGLGESEAIEMAYENVIAEAKRAIYKQRRPKQ